MAEVNLAIIIGAALIDGINPCAFGVLIFLLAFLMKTAKSPKKILINGSIYILAVFMTYFAAGLILLPIIQKLGQVSVITYLVLAAIIIIAGLIEIKDYFWYGRGFSLSIFPSQAARIKKYVKKISGNASTAFGLGVFVALVELPCTGAVYLAVLALMSVSGLSISNINLLIIYNIIFVLPLIVILITMYKGISAAKFKKWHQKHKGMMRLTTGIVLIALGTWMIFFVL